MAGSSTELIDHILATSDYYALLGVTRASFSQDDIRKNYIKIARRIHPDKHGNSEKATRAFQKLSTVYETLMDSTSRVNYNLGGASAGAQNVNADDVLDAVLRKIYQDFFDGDFEYILAMVDVLNDTAMHDPRYTDTQPPLDRERVKTSLTYLKEQLINAGKIQTELREPLVQFCDVWYKMRELKWFQIFTRVQLGVEMLHILCRLPLEAQSIQLPSMLNSVVGFTANTLWYTKQGLDMIAGASVAPPSIGATDSDETSDTAGQDIR